MGLKQRGFSGTLSDAVSEREMAHRKIARRIAAEGMVLLKNEGALPLQSGQPVALYGGGARYTIKGGTGSGAVNNRSNVSIDEGLRGAGVTITTDAWLEDYDRKYQKAREKWMESIYANSEPGDFNTLYRAHATTPLQMPKGADITKTDADTAIYVISRVSGEGADRKTEKGDYYLTDVEREELEKITSLYGKTIVVLNVGGIIDMAFVDELQIAGVVLMSQAGMEGGNALADVLTGVVNPSGKLTDTWAMDYMDYPSSATFSHNNGNIIEEKYTDGIYVGYRYFDSFAVKTRYPFGYGLSYTDFAVRCQAVSVKEDTVSTEIEVENTGSVPGKEVVQIYVSCPQGKLKKEYKRLTAFGKTKLLEPGEKQTIVLQFRISLLESYHAGQSSYFMEKGAYYLFVGTDAEHCSVEASMVLEETVRMQKLKTICPLLDAVAEIAPSDDRVSQWREQMKKEAEEKQIPQISLEDAVEKARIFDQKILEENRRKMEPGWNVEDAKAAELVEKLTLEQKTALACGRPGSGHTEFIGNAAVTVPGAAGETTNILKEEYGVGNMVLADGPAGIRIQKRYEENPADGSIYSMTPYQGLENRIFGTEFPHEGAISHYQFCSAIPVGTLLAQSFDLALMEEAGEMIGREMEEFNISLWLAPGMNIHRNPLCGRNFEYYSEDPVVSGMIAAALTKGVQKLPGIGTTIKHYACNNQEENRRGVSSILSERALREIYLKGFEIAIKEAQPMSIMTSYNKVNGVHTANSYDLCTVAAREEWGFEGIIMTDWTTTNMDGGSSAAKCVYAGNDLTMPGRMSDIQEIIDAVYGEKDQFIEERYLDDCARRMLRVIFASNCYEEAKSYLEGKALYSYMRQE